MLEDGTKLKIIENYYGLDKAIFGKNADEVETCCPILKEEYVKAKAATMSLMIEMYKHINLKMEYPKEGIQKENLIEGAYAAAVKARKNANARMLSENSKTKVKKMISESVEIAKRNKQNVDMKDVITEMVKIRTISNTIDDLLLGRFLNESNVDKLKTEKGKALYEAYIILRDDLVKSATTLMTSKE